MKIKQNMFVHVCNFLYRHIELYEIIRKLTNKKSILKVNKLHFYSIDFVHRTDRHMDRLTKTLEKKVNFGKYK